MGACEAQRGFLTLSGCQNPAVTSCSNCARAMCSTHLSPQTGFTMCFDCAATREREDEEEEAEFDDEESDDAWAHRYRDDYYEETGYAPVHFRTYDRHDARSFDDRESDAAEDDAERGGFGES